MEQFMVAKWGNSLAVRIPSRLAKELGIKEGDLLRRDVLALRRDTFRYSRQEALEIMRKARDEFPKGLKPEDWKIDRNDPDMRG